MSLLNNNNLFLFARFCIVGIISSTIDAVVFYIVRSFTIYQFALVCGYLLGLVFNYCMTIYWTFKTKATKRNFIGIVAAHLINLFVIRMGLMWLFVSCMYMSDKIAYMPTMIISVIVNFIMVKYAVVSSNQNK